MRGMTIREFSSLPRVERDALLIGPGRAAVAYADRVRRSQRGYINPVQQRRITSLLHQEESAR